jgi:glycosyltransferase involved in cell wall biosynthesis
MEKLSVVISTKNEETNIMDCLESVKWADEIILVDSSTDKTIEIASAYTNKIINSEDLIISVKKNIGIDKASNDWILSIDADERVTEDLQKEIIKAINNNKYNAYYINRKSFFIKKFINHCGWFPDYQIKLFRKSAGIKYNNALIHEKPVYNGEIIRIDAPIIHFTYRTIEEYFNKMNYYTTLQAKMLFDKGKNCSILDIILRPVLTFIKMYFLKLGILDGYTGLLLCKLSSISTYTKYSKLYFLRNNKINGKPN